MYYVIQENLFKEYGFKFLIEHLERNKLDYEIIKFRPFVDPQDIEVKTKRKDIFLFGSINASKIADLHDWNPGHFVNDNFDYEVYSKPWQGHMLNGDGWVQNIGEPLPEDRSVPNEFFARPTKDTKQFSGQLFNKASWADWTKDLKDSNLMQEVEKETRVLIAPVKDNILQEIRCWMVDDEPVTISQYKIGRRVNFINMDNNEEALIFARHMAKKFSPARAWVLDICLQGWEDSDYKIVEIGCINHCGFYDANMSKLIQSLEKTFGNG